MVIGGTVSIDFIVTVEGSISCKSVLLLGSLPELGGFQDEEYVRMRHLEAGKYGHSIRFSRLLGNFEYQYLLLDAAGQFTLGDRRTFTIPTSKLAGIRAHFLESGNLAVELYSNFSDSSLNTVHVYVQSPRMGPLPSMENFQSILSQLQRENESLKHEVLRLSSLVDGSTVSCADNLRDKADTEIKNLLNEINDLRGKVRVIGRFRPLMDFDQEGLEYALHAHPDGSSSVVIHEDRHGTPREYHMDDVLGEEVDNRQLFEKCQLQELMECAVLVQNNVCIFCYGQTGSGKSYTMMGPLEGGDNEPGVIGMSLEAVFETLHANRNISRHLNVEVLEIYMDQIFSIIPRCAVGSKEEIIDLYLSSVGTRATASTAMNETSSRSHFVFILSLFDENTQIENQIFFVDLAGSERTKVTNAQGDRLMEANFINKSLSTLGLVLNGLLIKTNTFIPYRDSKLTKLLSPVFVRSSPSSKVLMIANLSPNAEDQRETISTLTFAQRVGKVEMKNFEKDAPTRALIEQKEKQLLQLRTNR